MTDTLPDKTQKTADANTSAGDHPPEPNGVHGSGASSQPAGLAPGKSGALDPAKSQPPKVAIVHNLLPKRLRIRFKSQPPADQLLFAPLERQVITFEPGDKPALEQLHNRRLIDFTPSSGSKSSSGAGTDWSGLVIGGVFGYIFGGVAVNSNWPQYAPLYWWGVPGLIALGGIVLLLSIWKGRTVVAREASQSLTLLLVLTIGIGLSAATEYYFAEGPALLARPASLVLLARLLQLVFIALASVLPALLYYLFDREQLGTLRERFERQIFRLDPQVQSLADVEVKYGSRLNEYFGGDPASSRGRLGGGTRWPILVCTTVLTIGWLLVLLPVGPAQVLSGPQEILGFFLPQRSAISFGFLGAYYFAINMILRRYTRGDLQPKVYSHITVRVVVVLILAWVTEMLFGATAYTNLLVFIFGIVPETFLTALKELYRNGVQTLVADLEEKHPLTRLEGIDLYDRSRLLEEGVTNVEGLAHDDLVDLILTTRIPVPRLIDWLDQAILYLHVAEEAPEDKELGGGKESGGVSLVNRGGGRPASTLRQRLRAYGVRTATDYIAAYTAAERQKRLPEFMSALAGASGSSTEPTRLQVIYDALQDDEWLDSVRLWRENKPVGEVTVEVDEAGGVEEHFPAAQPSLAGG